MTVNNIKISKAFLESGNDLKLSEKLTIRHPMISEILELGDGINCDDVYWNYVFTMLSDPYDNMVWLDDRGIDYEDQSGFDVFVLRWEDCVSEYIKNKAEYDRHGVSPLDRIRSALTFFLGDHWFDIGEYDDKTKALYDKNDLDVQISSDTFNCISTFIQLIHGFDKSDRIYPANKAAKKILIEDKRFELKKMLRKGSTNSDNDYLGDIISAVVYGGNGGITPFNFKQLKFHQLYSCMNTDQKHSHYNHIMDGVYFGTIPFEKINKKEINWMS